jgi:sterol 3beta-glucosyltransferase
MKAILASLGTAGDFEPLLALAVGLKRRGHHAVLANSPDFGPRARQHGIPFAPIGPSIDELGLPQCLQRILALESPVEHARETIGTVVPFVPQMVDELDKVSADSDVLVCLPYQLAGFMSHERTGIPYVAWNFSPFGANPNAQFAQATSELINGSRLKVGLKPHSDPFAQATLQARVTLFAASRHTFRRPRSWPPHYHMTGYFFLDEKWEPAADLLRFIDSGPRPVVITFGSMRHSDPSAVTRLLFETVERLGCRAVLQAGWSGLGQGETTQNVHVATGFVPHGWLFARAGCVVHHGAAGTTAAALKAGVPSVIVPHALDQPLWAELMRAFGAAHSVIPFRHLSVERLVEAIDGTLSSTKSERFFRLAENVRLENGVDRAITLIEQYVS